ncbi:MAG: alpha/beta hydrolase [Campylobacter sp.]|nr:alpha/beta hydrolase [Campylobacter sp.]
MAIIECDLNDENSTQISVPTLIIHGENDIGSSLENDAKRIHSLIKNSKLEVLKDTNHFPITEKTDEVIRLIREFIKTL